MAMVQLERVREARNVTQVVRVGADRKTIGPFILLSGDTHFLVSALDHLRWHLEQMGRTDLAGLLPAYESLRTMRNAFEHPDGPSAAAHAEEHQAVHNQHSWTVYGDGRRLGQIGGVLNDADLDTALPAIEAALWSPED